MSDGSGEIKPLKKRRAPRQPRFARDTECIYPIRTTKCALSSMVRSRAHLDLIRSIVLRMNQLRTLVSFALKYHMLTTFERGQSLPANMLTQKYIKQVFNAFNNANF